MVPDFWKPLTVLKVSWKFCFWEADRKRQLFFSMPHPRFQDGTKTGAVGSAPVLLRFVHWGPLWADLDQNFSGWGVAAWCGRGWVAPGPVPPSHLPRWGCVSAGAGARFCCAGVSSLPLGPRCAGLGQGFFGWGRGRRARPPAGSSDPTPPRHAGPADARAARPPGRQTARPRASPRPPTQGATEPPAAARAWAAEHRTGHQTPADPADGFFV